MMLATVLSLMFLQMASADSACQTLRAYVESACDYPSLTVTSVPNGYTVNKENCNSIYNKSEWQLTPKIQWENAKADKTYTILSIDPDAPNHAGGQYYLHAILTNVKGEELANGDWTANEVKSYIGPAPPKGTGLHRYIFLIFQEEKNNGNVMGSVERRQFELLPWLRGQTSMRLCGPLAGTQFRAEF